MECTWCGEVLNEEEEESPRRDYDDDAICDDCYYEEYMSTCPSCCEYYETEGQESDIFLLFEDGLGVPPGIYRPALLPFYSQPLIGSPNIWPSDVKFIASIETVPAHIPDESGYPATFICKSCEDEILKKYLPVVMTTAK